MPLLINLLPFPILIWCRVRQIVLELHNLASAANCHIPQCRIKCLLSKLTLYRHVPLASRRALALPYQAGTAPTSFLLLSMHAIPKITAVWLRHIFIFPLQHSLQPRYQFSLSTATAWSTKIKLHRGVVPGVLLSAPLRARSLPPGPPFSSANLDRFLRSRTCTSHDSAASTRREPSTCSTSHQGPADRTLKTGKMLLSLAGRTPRLGKRRPWSRNQAGKGGVGLRYHTPGEARGPNLLYCTVSWTAVHANGSHIVCMQRCNAEVAPSTSFPFGCGLLRLATSYGRAAENNSLRRGTAPGRDLLDRPTSMLTKHKS
jgi:hypothetical protein